MILLEIYLAGFLIVLIGTKIQNYYFSTSYLDYTPLKVAIVVAFLSWVTMIMWLLAFVIIPSFEAVGRGLVKVWKVIKRAYEYLVWTEIAQKIDQWFEKTPYDHEAPYKTRLKDKK